MAKTKNPELLYVYTDKSELTELEEVFSQKLPALGKEKSVKIKFLHQEEFKKKITTLEINFPIIFLREKSRLRIFLSVKKIRGCKDLKDLRKRVEERLKNSKIF